LKPARRKFLRLAAGAAALPFAPGLARAQAYPTRPVHLIVGFPPGGGADIAARITGQWLSERLGQPFVIENRPGGGSNIAAAAVINSRPDGYTLLLATGSNAVNATFYASLPFNFLRDIEPVAGLIDYPLILVVNPRLPAKTTAEFISYANANPAKISMASFGTGTSSHLSWELLKLLTGLNLVHVPYRGEALALNDIIGGQVQAMFCTPAGSLEHIKANTVRALGATSASAWDGMPGIPPIADAVPGYESRSWNGVGAPRGTPRAIIDTLNREINAGLADAAIKARLGALGVSPMVLTPGAFETFLAAETEKWGKVVKASGARPD
jgi:tripartite-type tricarboxylate transporter receptor subunit TctC